jgi:hypothetical protein
MPVHDWSKVDTGTFHAFRNAWLTHLMGTLNRGILPRGYYALSDQRSPALIPDVLMLNRPEIGPGPSHGNGDGGIALADAPPEVSRKMVADPKPPIAHGAVR